MDPEATAETQKPLGKVWSLLLGLSKVKWSHVTANVEWSWQSTLGTADISVHGVKEPSRAASACPSHALIRRHRFPASGHIPQSLSKDDGIDGNALLRQFQDDRVFGLTRQSISVMQPTDATQPMKAIGTEVDSFKSHCPSSVLIYSLLSFINCNCITFSW